MIHITIEEEDGELIDDLHKAGYLPTSLPEGKTLKTWLIEQQAKMQELGQADEQGAAISVTLRKKALEISGANIKTRWLLDSAKLELIISARESIPISHNECCILRAAAGANGHLVSRKTLIEALGQNFLHYDERRLEALISRLRRKLLQYSDDGFPVRAVKGQGYLFMIEVQLLPD